MTETTNTVHEFPVESQSVPPKPMSVPRPLYWSIRRELWENRSIYMAPVIVEAVFLFGYLLSMFTLPRRINAVLAASAAKQQTVITGPFSAAAFLMIVTAFLVGVFYCLDALQGERRDRSILFWKSLPVSDRTTVLAKASIPLFILPMLVFTIAMTARMIMAVLSTVVLLGNTRSVATFWTHMHFFQSSIALLYGVIAITLWHAPVYAWLLLISGWAKRAAVLWAILPFLAIGAFERMLFSTSYFMHALGFRMTGWFKTGFVFPPKGSQAVMDPLAHLTPGRFLSSPSLWFGLIFAALFLTAAVRLRRNKEPI